jgi:hypothetical protein
VKKANRESDPKSRTATDLLKKAKSDLNKVPHGKESEQFLQVLMDEDFLAKAARSAGAVLVVDPSEPTRGILGPPLVADGFDVTVLSSAAAAEAWLGGHSVDLIIASGTEAGGHTGEVGTMVLVPDVVDAVAPIPVLAAGGIGSGRQVTGLHQDGRRIPLELGISVMHIGAGRQFCGIVREITQRLEAEQALQQSERKMRSYIEQSLDAVFVVDADAVYHHLLTSSGELKAAIVAAPWSPKAPPNRSPRSNPATLVRFWPAC